MKKLFGLLLLLLLPLSFIHATTVFSNPDDSSLLPDTWTNGTSETIAWTSSISPAKLVLFRNTTGNNVFVKNIITLPAGAKSYPWIVNVATPGPGYKIAICPTTAWLLNYNSACQFSNSFTVAGPVTETPTSTITPTLTVSPSTIQPGGSATLNWKCDPVAKCYCLGSLIPGGTGQLLLSELGLGSKAVSPTQTTTYTLSCRDKTITNASYTSKTTTLTVSSDPITPSVKIVLKANDVDQDITIKAGTTVNLSWQKVGTGVGFTSCRLGSTPQDTSWDGVGGNFSGYKPVTPTVTTSYSIICWDSAETNYTDNLKVTVEGVSTVIPPTTTDYTKFACKSERQRINLFYYKNVYRCVEDPTGTSNRTQCLADCDPNTGSTNIPVITTPLASCSTPISLSIDDLFYNLRNNKPATIPSEDFNRWTSQNEAEIKESIDNLSVCHPTPALTVAEAPVQALQGAKKYTDKGIPTMLALVVGPKLSHMVVALKVTSTSIFPGYYKLKIFDPNGPSIVTINCQPKLITIFAGQPKKRVTFCENPSGIGEVMVLQTNAFEEWNKITDQLVKNKVRDNPAAWLENNYTKFTNFNTDSNTVGTCTGISEFNIRAAFLIKTSDQPCPTPVSFWNSTKSELMGFVKNTIETLQIRLDF